MIEVDAADAAKTLLTAKFVKTLQEEKAATTTMLAMADAGLETPCDDLNVLMPAIESDNTTFVPDGLEGYLHPGGGVHEPNDPYPEDDGTAPMQTG